MTKPQEKQPAALKEEGLVFSAPDLVAEIEFRGWTADGKLRHASFNGLREDSYAASPSFLAPRTTICSAPSG